MSREPARLSGTKVHTFTTRPLTPVFRMALAIRSFGARFSARAFRG